LGKELIHLTYQCSKLETEAGDIGLHDGEIFLLKEVSAVEIGLTMSLKSSLISPQLDLCPFQFLV
jgi:hypothetical protein